MGSHLANRLRGLKEGERDGNQLSEIVDRLSQVVERMSGLVSRAPGHLSIEQVRQARIIDALADELSEVVEQMDNEAMGDAGGGGTLSPELIARLDQAANGEDEVELDGTLYRRSGPKDQMSDPGPWTKV